MRDPLEGRLIPLLPEGVCDFLPKEAKRLRMLEGSIREGFGQRGYEEVILPAIEPIETVLTEASFEGFPKGLMGFMEPTSGRFLGLRQDFTPQIVRLVASQLKHVKLPIRLFYMGSTFSGDPGLKRLEEHQGGAELIGEAGIEADAEVIGMACGVLKSMGLSRFRIYVGDASFLQSLLDAILKKGGGPKNFFRAWSQRNLEAIEAQIEGLSLDHMTKEALKELPFFVGPLKTAQEKFASLKWPPFKQSLTRFQALMKALQNDSIEASEVIQVDYGATPRHSYYTGLFFEGYLEGYPGLLALGGRYDRLFSVFESAVPAVGVGFKLSSILESIND
jgi:ATP phosphoribosyltransferase regulatory subunit